MRSKLTIITFISLAVVFISCSNGAKSDETEDKSTVEKNREQIDKVTTDSEEKDDPDAETNTSNNPSVSEFIANLKTGENLGRFFSDNWIFVYHEDNRCDGSTDGNISNLTSSQIDSTIKLQVKNDGEGWACEKKEPETFDLDFDLRKRVEDWDRFELSDEESAEESIIYIEGKGASDYLKLHLDDNNLIIKLEYRSEDPG